MRKFVALLLLASCSAISTQNSDFSREAIAITAGPVQCETRVLTGCARVLYPAEVSFDGGPPVTISTGQTRAVGPFDVTVESFEGARGGNCDLPGWTELAGLRVR